jgi:hypothetical protein
VYGIYITKKGGKYIMMKIIKLFTTSVAALTLFLLASVASAATLELTQTEKEVLYDQYVEIVAEIESERDGVILEVAPMELFSDEDWITPEKFKQLAIDRANISVEIVPQDANVITPFSTATASKSKTISSSELTRTVTARGSFETGYNSTAGRQVFTGINSLTSSMSGTGKWEQTGYTPSRIDGGRTYTIALSGKFTINGLVSGHHLYYEFYCNPTGGVS